MGRMFGTDGVRGVVNQDLTPELAFRLGQAGAMVLTNATHHKPKILIGKDTRISSDMIEAALTAGVCSVGAEVVLLGVVPTPAVAHLTRVYQADAGIVISASHNPMEYNGIKFFDAKGYKLPDALEDEIESMIVSGKAQVPMPIGGGIGRVIHKYDAVNEYMNFAMSTIANSLDGMHIVIDCANGAACGVSKPVLEQLGARVTAIHDMPDGLNINRDCGSTHIGDLQKKVLELKADFGLAFDGDADRVLAVDEKGILVDGDKIMSICALEMDRNKRLKDGVIVATVMSNLGLHLMAKKHGLSIMQTHVGDRYVLEKMVECDYKLGGEQSGHIIFLDYNTTGDGLVTGLQLASVIAKSGKKLSELAQVMQVMPQILINARVSGDKESYKGIQEITDYIASIEGEFAGEGRVLIRPSGTEPFVRVMIEGSDLDKITARAKELVQLIEKSCGA